MIKWLPLKPEKLVATMLYLAHRVNDPTKWRIGKLLFLADFAHLGRYGRPIVGGCYCAMPNGPVPSEALELMNGLLTGAVRPDFWHTNVESAFEIKPGQYPLFFAKVEPDMEELSESDIEVLDEVIEKFGKLIFSRLSEIVHAMPAYVRATERKPDSKNPDMDYEDFWEGNQFALHGTKELMQEDYALQKAFPDDAA